MGYGIIASDLDGTLITDDGRMLPEVIEAIRRAMDFGIHFVICSGRSPASLKKFLAQAELNKEGSFGIGFNGAAVFEADTMRIIFEHRLKRENALDTIRLIKEADSETPIIVYAEEDLTLNDMEHDQISGYASHSGITRRLVTDFNEAIRRDVFKIILRWEPQRLRALYDKLSGRLSDVGMFYSADNLLEFAPMGCDKSAGVSALSRHVGVPMKEIICVGDNYNDFEMIRDAGLGVAVQNAVAGIKDAAGMVTKADNNNGAIIEVIELALGHIAV